MKIPVSGRPTRTAAEAAIKAHVAVCKGKPLRVALSDALANGGNLGGKERRFAAFAVRELSRHLRYVDALAKARGRAPAELALVEDRVLVRYVLWRTVLTECEPGKALDEVKLPGPIRPRTIPDAALAQLIEQTELPPESPDPLERAALLCSFPNWLAQAVFDAAPAGEGPALLHALNLEPTLTLRARPVGNAAQMAAELAKKGIEVAVMTEAPDALRLVGESRAVFESGAMKTGRLQVMDLGSQMLAALCEAKPGMTVVDYCAGAGGKTLVLADAVGPTGKVIAHDSSAKRLEEARRRTREHHVKNVRFDTAPAIESADLVLIDAPCSGSGTLGKEPDQKWKLTAEAVTKFAATQSQLLDEVGTRLKSGGVLVYGTCSVLREENEAVIDAFLKRRPEFARASADLRVWPHRLPSGGYFGARLVKA